MVKACIFDLDGVLVDTAHYHFIAWRRLGQELGVVLTERDNERLKGVSRMQSLEIILALQGIKKTAAEKEQLAARKNEWFVGYINEIKPEELFPGVRELLASLRARGIKIGLASSSKNAPTVIRLLGIEREFDAIVDGTMITHSKPDPEIFQKAAEKLGVAPADCLVFEDAEAGIEAASRAGMKSVGVGSPDQLKEANVILRHIADFDLKELTKL